MEAKRERTEPTAAASAASAAPVLAVLGNDDLLREILLRLGFPTTLVRAALVAKRWLGHASDPVFLRCFRERHPPALLGFYASHRDLPRPQFLPVSQAPELFTAIRRASFPEGPYSIVMDCRNGRGLVWSDIVRPIDGIFCQWAVFDLLQPTRGVVFFPPRLPCIVDNGVFLPEDGGSGADGVVAVNVFVDDNGTTVYAEVYTFQSGSWIVRTTPEIELPEHSVDLSEPPHAVVDMAPPSEGKVYISTDSGYILVLDLAATSLCIILLLHRIMTIYYELLCREEDSGLFFIHAEGFLLSIWHHKADGNGTHNWVLIHDKIIVHEVYSRHEDVIVMGVDDNLEYVFLWLEESELLVRMHLRSRAEKVYDELTLHDKDFLHIRPFMMIWPPVFPALREENNLEE